jgi:antitoxin MazE
MKVKLISVGNSKAIRLPKAFIKQLGDAREVELEIQDQTVIVRSPKPIRQGWAAAFARAAATEKNKPPIAGRSASSWDETEWTW